MARLVTEWRSDDPQIAEALKAIAALPEFSAERAEAEAGLHMLQARWCWRDADRLRAIERDREARAVRRAKRQEARDGEPGNVGQG